MSFSEMTAEEERKLQEILKKAEQFEKQEELDLMRQPLEGMLLKFTNAFQGWQNRWCVLDPESGELRYYLKSDTKSGKPRGLITLSDAAINPNEDDSLSFSIVPFAGEISYKFKASDTKQKQEWINRLRTVAEDHREKKMRKIFMENVAKTPLSSESVLRGTACDATLLNNVQKTFVAATEQQRALYRAVDKLPDSTADGGRLSSDILSLKAYSHMLLNNLQQCEQLLDGIQRSLVVSSMDIDLHHHAVKFHLDSRMSYLANAVNTRLKQHDAAGPSWFFNKPSKAAKKAPTEAEGDFFDACVCMDDKEATAVTKTWSNSAATVSGDATVAATRSLTDRQKQMLLSYLSSLKLGTDVTRAPMPAFLLQSRSFLEDCADFFANSSYFASIVSSRSADDRMVGVVKWYLTAFHHGLRFAKLRVPVIPAFGEFFRCVWALPVHRRQNDLRFIAQRVNLQPPVVAFRAALADASATLKGFMSAKAVLIGTAVKVAISGEAKLQVFTGLRHGTSERRKSMDSEIECYRLSFPSFTVRSILSSPWLDLNGRVKVFCPKTGLSCSVVFSTRSLADGEVYKVSAEVKDRDGHVHCVIRGDIDHTLEISRNNYPKEVVDISGIERSLKKVCRGADQQTLESRKLWASLFAALRAGNAELAESVRNNMERTYNVASATPPLYFKATSDGRWSPIIP